MTSNTDRHQVGTELRGLEAEAMLLKANQIARVNSSKLQSPRFALADGWHWLLNKDSNGDQMVMKAVAEVPKCLSSQRDEYDCLNKLYEAVTNTYPQLLALPGFERLSEGVRSSLILRAYYHTDYTQQQFTEWVLKDAERCIKQAIDEANLVESEEPLDELRYPRNHESYKGLDIGAYGVSANEGGKDSRDTLVPEESWCS